MKAVWNGVVVAESKETIEVEGNQYFPPQSVNRSLLVDSKKETVCVWKGTANYYDIYANGKINKDAAWFYAHPKEKAQHITNYVAFWHGVEIVP